MTIKADVTIRSTADVASARENLARKIDREELQPLAEQLLREQIDTTLVQFDRQLADETGQVKRITADRVFEGDGYRVALRLRLGPASPWARLKNLFGLE